MINQGQTNHHKKFISIRLKTLHACSGAKILWFVTQNYVNFSSTAAHSLNAHLAVHPHCCILLSLDSTLLHCLCDFLLLMFVVWSRSWLLFVRDAESLEKVTLVIVNELGAFLAESAWKCFCIFVATSVRENGRKTYPRLQTIDEDSWPRIVLCLLLSVGACFLRKWLSRVLNHLFCYSKYDTWYSV